MNSSNSTAEPCNESCKYDDKCEELSSQHCEGCGKMYCIDHFLQHQIELAERIEQIVKMYNLLNEKFKSLLSELSREIILDLIKQIYEFQTKLKEIENTTDLIQNNLRDLCHQEKNNFKTQPITTTNEIYDDRTYYLENNIDCLKKDVEKLELKLKEINDYFPKTKLEERLKAQQLKTVSNNEVKTIKSPPLSIMSSNECNNSSSNSDNPIFADKSKLDYNSVLFNMVLKLRSTPSLDQNENEITVSETENEAYEEEKEKGEGEEEEATVLIGSDSETEPKVSRKIHLSNNIVRWLRGPFKIMVDGTMHVVDLCAQGKRMNSNVIEAVKRGLIRQKQIILEQKPVYSSIKPAFTEITSNWTFEGENVDRGFSSVSIWMRDSQDRRVLVKTQDHPLCAANEWLAYVLGQLIDLPVNEVQIAIYEDKLVTVHADVAQENEKTISFMDLPKHIRKKLFTDATMARMDLFDHIIQNVDRNERNILITMPSTTDMVDDTTKLKMHLIDHASCFGMGKLNFISIVACKFHSDHLSVVTFDPIEKAKLFEQYLNKIPVTDRCLIRKTLNRFAAIDDGQLDRCITAVQNLLSSSQYNRIHGVIYRQRDIARRYTIKWDIYSGSFRVKSNETNDTITHF